MVNVIQSACDNGWTISMLKLFVSYFMRNND